jgi:hypothetical protein
VHSEGRLLRISSIQSRILTESYCIKLSGGAANSSNEVPGQLSWIVTRRIDVINPGETASIPEIFGFGWFTYYRIEISSAEGASKMFDQWVTWRSWGMPLPPSWRKPRSSRCRHFLEDFGTYTGAPKWDAKWDSVFP